MLYRPRDGKDDQSFDGSKARPFKSLAYAYIRNIDKPSPRYLARVWVYMNNS